MTKKNEVVTTEEAFDTALPAHLQGKMEGQARGSEDVQSDDLTIPRIQIIQALSPQKKKTDASYIEGAEEGDCFNTATEQLFKDGFYLVPVYFRKEYLIWQSERSSDGNGFRGAYSSELEAETARRNLEAPDRPEDFEVVATNQQFCMIIDPETKTCGEAVISMAKSQMKVSKRLNSQIRLAGGDRFAHVFKFDVVDDKSPSGEFYNWGFKKVGYAPEWAYKEAEKMYDAIKSGARDIARDEPTGQADTQPEPEQEFPDEM